MKKKPPSLLLPVARVVSHIDAARVGPGTVAAIGQRAAVFLAADPTRPGAAHLRRAIKFADAAARAIECGMVAAAAMSAAAAVQAAWQAELIEADARWYRPAVAVKVAAVDKQSADRSRFAVVGNKARTKYTDDDKARWKRLATRDANLRRLRATSVRGCAKAIAAREGLPDAAIETIRKVI